MLVLLPPLLRSLPPCLLTLPRLPSPPTPSPSFQSSLHRETPSRAQAHVRLSREPSAESGWRVCGALNDACTLSVFQSLSCFARKFTSSGERLGAEKAGRILAPWARQPPFSFLPGSVLSSMPPRIANEVVQLNIVQMEIALLLVLLELGYSLPWVASPLLPSVRDRLLNVCLALLAEPEAPAYHTCPAFCPPQAAGWLRLPGCCSFEGR
jgi:hypothetical protein